MQFDGPPCDGQAQPHAATATITVSFHAVERVENVVKSFFGNTRPVITNLDTGCGSRELEPHLDNRLLRSIANGVADHVLRRAAQQFGITGNGYRAGRLQHERATASGSLDCAIAHHAGQQIIQPHGLGTKRIRVDLGARHLQ